MERVRRSGTLLFFFFDESLLFIYYLKDRWLDRSGKPFMRIGTSWTASRKFFSVFLAEEFKRYEGVDPV